MKDPLSLKTSMNEEIENALNHQKKQKLMLHLLIYQSSTWCGENGYDNSAGFFANQAEEEDTHAEVIQIYK